MRIGGEIADLPELGADARVFGERIHPRQRVPTSIRVDGAEEPDARAERHGIRIAARGFPDRDRERAVGVSDDLDGARVELVQRHPSQPPGRGAPGSPPAAADPVACCDRLRATNGPGTASRRRWSADRQPENPRRHPAAKRRIRPDVEQRDDGANRHAREVDDDIRSFRGSHQQLRQPGRPRQETTVSSDLPERKPVAVELQDQRARVAGVQEAEAVSSLLDVRGTARYCRSPSWCCRRTRDSRSATRRSAGVTGHAGMKGIRRSAGETPSKNARSPGKNNEPSALNERSWIMIGIS